MSKFEVSCYGKDGAKIATIDTSDLDTVIDHLAEGTEKIIVHDGETGKYVMEL